MEQFATDTAIGVSSSPSTAPENLGAAGMDAYARHLSRVLLVVVPSRQTRTLLGKRRREIRRSLELSAKTIERAYRAAAATARSGKDLTIDAEWLLDNYYVVDELVRDVRQHMPPDFLAELPCVINGRPRVYELARELISHSDSALDESLLERFVESFQSEATLTIGECWALPVMLRLVLLEQLKSLAEQTLYAYRCETEVSQLLDQPELPGHFELDASAIAQSGPKIVELHERLRARGEEGLAAIRNLERQLQNLGLDMVELMRLEHRRQAASHVSIGNVITSMRLLATLDWVAFFEQTNRTEQVLRQDPMRIYARMDLASRNRYRTVVERIAKSSDLPDDRVAEAAIARARQHAAADAEPSHQLRQRPAMAAAVFEDLRSHVGYWLVGEGAREFAGTFNGRQPITGRFERAVSARPHLAYFGTLLLVWLLTLATLVLLSRWIELSVPTRFILAILAALPLTEIALATVNNLVTRVVSPRLLPKLEFDGGIPEECPTIVVVPSLIGSQRDVRSLIDRLENHFLANQDPMLRFALLTDFPDADDEVLSEDAALLQMAVDGIEELNRRHGNSDYQPFYLFHRRRMWNPSEGAWMGWERKRGKLMEFGRLLRGDAQTSYDTQVGDVQWLARLRQKQARPFIITLDADTILPRDTARRLVGTLAHPLNRPRLSADGRTVCSGYTILQPRVSVHLAGAKATPYVETFANSPGIDPYTTAASDVYQDLFAEGSFTGKGIYDLHAFERSLEQAFPENLILSHDLIEGCHARVALVSDIEVYDSYPTRYDADLKRTHRWIRGDWQIMPWLFPRVPYASGTQVNRLSWLSKWKIADNLRRSLTMPALVVFLLVGWGLGTSAAWLTTAVGLCILFWPAVLQMLNALYDLPSQKYLSSYLAQSWNQWLQSLRQCGLLVLFSLHRAVVMIDAIARTLYRMTISRRKMLQWETAAAVETRLSQSRWSILQQMWYSPVVAAVCLLWNVNGDSWLASLPFTVSWLFAPLVAFLVSQPRKPALQALSATQRGWLRSWASATWSFFEAYVNEQSNWLPPDNVQDYPREKVAHRISPTNEGLFLVSGLAARDFGFIGLHALVGLWERNWNSWQQLEQYRGHHYNWYETRSLAALPPRYVSTVDSGNLVACYVTLQSAIKHHLLDQPVLSAETHAGVMDTLTWIESSARSLFTDKLNSSLRIMVEDLLRVVARLQRDVAQVPQDVPSWRQLLDQLDTAAGSLQNSVHQLATESATKRLSKKVELAIARFAGLREDARLLLPWINQADQAAPPSIVSGVCSPSLRELAELDIPSINEPEDSNAASQVRGLRIARQHATQLISRLTRLAESFENAAAEMDFKFLFNTRRKLFTIGFNVEESRADRSHYDMLCSESRLASYLAIAKGDVETNHWFRLGRQSTQIDGRLVLLSWGGTMFEYMMPPLFQRQYPGSLLTESCHAAVHRQQSYARGRGVPWGISESAYSSLASNSDYHYRSFGTPGLGLKRGLAKDLVISPYSTMLALPLEPTLAVQNLQTIVSEGGLGDWGFYEALDYTSSRLRRGRRVVPVECTMAHHQGMSLTALANALMDNVMQQRFHQHPWARANELLLQERVPQIATPNRQLASQTEQAPVHKDDSGLVSRRITGVQTTTPRTHLLSNGSISVMLSHVGGGYLQWQDQQITRWRSDTTRDNWGEFIYLHDLDLGQLWSPSYQPTLCIPDYYEVVYSMDKAEFHRRQGDIETTLEVAVSPECNAVVRQLRLINHGASIRRIAVTSYSELAMNTAAADLAHPAFQKLFIETEYIAEETSLLARRRPRSADGQPLYAVHTIVTPNELDAEVQFDTSRHSFLGRNRTTENPHGATIDRLAGNIGAVLDPVFALRTTVSLAPGEAVTVGFSTAVASTREQALALADQFHDQRGIHRVFELAWAFAQTESRHGSLDGQKNHLFQRLGSALLYPDLSLRGDQAFLIRNSMTQPGLWRYGISGDLPIMTCRVSETDHFELVRELVQAHRFLLGHGLFCDLVIVNDYPGSYVDALQDQLQTLINESPTGDRRLGAIHLLRGAQLPIEDHMLVETVSACVFRGTRGSLSQQLDAAATRSKTNTRPPVSRLLRVEPSCSTGGSVDDSNDRLHPTPSLEFANGLGGFIDDGRAYVIEPTKDVRPGAPWSNVIANARFGTLVTEAGGGNSWFENSRENKLTAWSNDPVADQPGELLYLRDDADARLWSPLPISPEMPTGHYRCQHGFGYSHFHCVRHGLQQDVYITVAENDPLKIVRLRIHNASDRDRSLTCTYYVDWVLGAAREKCALTVITQRDEATGALLARHPYSTEYPGQVAFLQMLANNTSLTGDRKSFIGRNGSLLAPQALALVESARSGTEESNDRTGADFAELDGNVGAGLDPCGAVQSSIHVPAGQSIEVFILLGAGTTGDEAHQLLAKYATHDAVRQALDNSTQAWRHTLTALTVQTPNRAMDLLVNGWLQYQTLSCRLWGRSAFYQSGGAFGFRDQLQDVMALVNTRPDLARQHILRAASRQFPEGDVQHWWHPPTGKGTRTRFSDDFLFLPYVTDYYLRATGDTSILDEQVGFVSSATLHEHEQERYEHPIELLETATLYEHCLRALEHGKRYGQHGLPLMGCGDWNDGMNKVGEEGRGESVWVALFQIVVFNQFLQWMHSRGDSERAQSLSELVDRLRDSVAQHAWDGQWYRRAYFDDGSPLGSHQNTECRIDSLTQSWAVIAGLDSQRDRMALQAAVTQLVRWPEKIVLLFTPPFDHSDQDPGYIKGYLPGIRENGGQYTHAATWLIDAATRLGESGLAMKLFDAINPIHHTSNHEAAMRYRVEPYVMAADVYSVPPHVGMGGWTWYTGSASWTYRVAVESILGLRLNGSAMMVKPCVPDEWTEFQFTYRRGNTAWHVTMRRQPGVTEPWQFCLHEDGQEHHLEGYFS